ncbi:DUF2975 domain-containing protein [Alistipes sp.]|uniref:DUF2975 domain-containing protein n=1 Tax=Alistipes sp. TaxID=1872444 RepID=UPI000E80941B|nr:DUF2975 domain-containing protein [Alistipes sp.]HBX90673.1 DUF2975 domain-containing protein [Alistipes sp.]HCN13937.1 DUF2975 domain-containing protein [Alistipes sp.]
MQNKKSLLRRLLAIYVTFFVVLVVSLAHSLAPNFSRGYAKGTAMGDDIMKNWVAGTPRQIYLLNRIPVSTEGEVLRGGASDDPVTVRGYVSHLSLTVEEQAPGRSAMQLAFRSIGGSPWLYLTVMLVPVCLLAIIVMMFFIIGSLRRSIREERPLGHRNVVLLRAIGALTIFVELLQDTSAWFMARRAARLLADTPYAVDTQLHVSYSTIIMGILVLFAAEVFALGRNLSEEQRLTI